MERRRRVGASAERKERAEVAVFHEVGKGLTSSPQLDQGLRTIVEKIDEFLMRTPGLCCFVDEVQQELYLRTSDRQERAWTEGRRLAKYWRQRPVR